MLPSSDQLQDRMAPKTVGSVAWSKFEAGTSPIRTKPHGLNYLPDFNSRESLAGISGVRDYDLTRAGRHSHRNLNVDLVNADIARGQTGECYECRDPTNGRRDGLGSH